MAKPIIFVENMPAFYEAAYSFGERVMLNLADGTVKRKQEREVRRMPKPVANVPYQAINATVRLESYQSSADAIKRLRVRSDGKAKTALSVLAKAHQTYAFKRPLAVISDVHLFNELTERFNKIDQWHYTQKVNTVRRLIKNYTVAPAVNASVMQRVGELFTAILLFKGVGYSDVKKDLVLAVQNNEKTVTYNVNTTVTYNERQFTVGKIKVKKTVGDGIFFCSKSCKPAQLALQAIDLCKNLESLE
jgi:hypothetical protein